MPDGAQLGLLFVPAPAVIDGVNGTLVKRAVPNLDKFGDPIYEVDDEGTLRLTYAKVEYQFVYEEPITGEIMLVAVESAFDIGVGAAVEAIANAINGDCKGSGCGAGPGIIVTEVLLENQTEVGVDIREGCGGRGCFNVN